ncbi:type II toxin-antitoxin system RelE/ParE family toxin [Sphingobium rhizovicinum]|uniref:Type II toxin-antitoxin system RelE/ParE family toxin n=1 Tax=Sphingobium rhizovicinum TaxID=432308 RepID=A0ABV7NFV5_9SPHN
MNGSKPTIRLRPPIWTNYSNGNLELWLRILHWGRPGRVTGTRELIVHRNYMLIYDVVGDVVRILRILHTRRQWPQVHE